MNEFEERIGAFHCPRWEELPDVELYVDQLVGYIEKHLSLLYIGQEGKFITASMINNYVKMKLIPAPVKKRYSVRHLARLIVVCALKRDFTISELHAMMDFELAHFENRVVYNLFCDEMESNIAAVFLGKRLPACGSTMEEIIVRTVMTAFANKLYAHYIILTQTTQPGGQVIALPVRQQN